MSELDRYLLGSEVCVATARRHWAVLLPQTLGVGLCWGAWVWVLNAAGSQFLDIAATFFFIFSFLWLAWLAGEWFTELFAVTDKRVLLVSGLFYKRLAVMPLSKVTDMTYERSPAGRIIGYGTFIMESAGQDQALSRIDYVRDPDRLYHQLSEELFGSSDDDKAVRNPSGNPDGPVFADTTRLPRLR
jgi:membrane protein YdbS with pleckstrin-like domain